MKQLKRIKRITLLPVIIAAFIVAIFAGIFLSFRARENKISASASSSVASFTAGASIGMSTSTADMIRFRLNISDTSEIESITVSVNPFKGCVFEGADMYTYTTNKGTAQIDISDGVLSVYNIKLRVNPQIEYTVTADIAKTDNTVERVTSDSRSIVYVLEKMKEAGDPDYEQASSVHRNYIDAVISAKDTDNSFSIIENAELLQSDGMVKLSVSVTDDVISYINSGKSEGVEKTEVTKDTKASVDEFLKANHFYDRHGSYYDWFGIETNLPFWHRYLTKCVLTHYELWVIATNDYLQDGFDWSALEQSPPQDQAAQGIFFRQYCADDIDFSSNNTVELKIDPSILGAGSKYYYVGLMKVDVNWYTLDTYDIKWVGENKLTRSDGIVEETDVAKIFLTGNYLNKDVTEWALQILEGSDVSQFTDEELKGYQTLAGVYNSEEQTQITLVYKKYNDDGTNIIDEENSFLIKSLYAQNMEAVINAMYLLKDFNKISDFNVVRKNSWFDKNQTEKQTGDRIVRQASGYKYEYDKENQTGVLTVEYADFQYKDVMVTMQSNDAESHLTKDFYTANATQTSEEIKLVFSYDDLEMWGKNNCDWLFGLNADNFSIVNNASDKVSIVNDGTARTLTVTCAPEDVNALDQVSITAVSEIVEDVPYQMTYNYKKIIDTAGTLSEETLQSDTVTLMYSELVSMSYENFITLYGGVVNDELLPATLAGTNYCKAIGFEKSYNTENLTCNITVTYEYGLIFKVTDNRTADWYKFLPKSDTTLLYKGDYFYDHGYDGCRVQKITTTLDETKIRITPAYTYKEITVELLATQFTDGIIPVCLNFTDKWLIEINYMEQYKDTPFAVKTKYSGEIRVSDFEDIYALTVSDLATILNKASMSIIRDRATVDTITVTYNEDTESYTVDTTYSLMSMVQIDYEGNRKEIKVPLTCYKDWCEDYGMDWTILYLNYSGNGKQYFRYSNEVKREDLYGFFSTAVFKERVSDLNYYFKNSTGAGCITMHESEEIRGSRIYQFFGGLSEIGILGNAVGRIGMIFCELVNDENAIYHSYFFFLDGTSDLSFLSNSGATSATDTDTAIKNTIQDIGDQIGEFFKNIFNSDNAFIKTIKIILGLVVFVVIFNLVFNLIVAIVNGIRKMKK